MLPSKALFALAAAAIAGTFVALMIKSRGPTDDDLHEHDALENYGEQQIKIASSRACRDAVGHAVSMAGDYLTSRYGEGAPDGIRELAVHRCTFDDWPGDVVSCLDLVTSDNEMQRCIGKLPEHHRRALEAEMRAFAQHPPKVPRDAAIDSEDDWNAGGDPYSLDPIDPTSALPPACTEYEQTMEKLAACDKLSQGSREAFNRGFDALKANWAQIGSLPKSARDALEAGCRQAVDAIKQADASICGW